MCAYLEYLLGHEFFELDVVDVERGELEPAEARRQDGDGVVAHVQVLQALEGGEEVGRQVGDVVAVELEGRQVGQREQRPREQVEVERGRTATAGRRTAAARRVLGLRRVVGDGQVLERVGQRRKVERGQRVPRGRRAAVARQAPQPLAGGLIALLGVEQPVVAGFKPLQVGQQRQLGRQPIDLVVADVQFPEPCELDERLGQQLGDLAELVGRQVEHFELAQVGHQEREVAEYVVAQVEPRHVSEPAVVRGRQFGRYAVQALARQVERGHDQRRRRRRGLRRECRHAAALRARRVRLLSSP